MLYSLLSLCTYKIHFQWKIQKTQLNFMNEINLSSSSKASLFKSILFALIVAIIILITVILPAEFGIDHTGIGSMLGLDALNNPNESPAIISRLGEGELEFRQDEVEVLIPANSGLEYKFFLEMHSNINYEWSSPSSLYFDMHGEPEGDTTGYFESYGASTTDGMKGSITVPFAGSHGWYWRNDTDQDISISLKTLGNYNVIGVL